MELVGLYIFREIEIFPYSKEEKVKGDDVVLLSILNRLYRAISFFDVRKYPFANR